jgi:3-hydroxyacyl-[acyl-carrier-protein] dehydratase
MRFLLVDRILDCPTTGPVRGLKQVAMSEDVLEHHFPGNPIMPGSLLLEALVQLAGWQVAFRTGFGETALLAGVRRCAFYGFVRPGDTVELEVEALSEVDGLRQAYRGTGRVAGAKKIMAEVEVELVPLAELEYRRQHERSFRQLCGDWRW